MTIEYDKIARDIYNQSPNEPYLSFLNRELFADSAGWGYNDPLAIDIDRLDLDDDLSIIRKTVEQEILPPVSQIIIGQSGSGKSTLMRILTRRLNEKQKVLVVNLSLRGTMMALDGKLASWDSPLGPNKLTWHLFNAFWEQLFIFSHSENHVLLQNYLEDKTWMRKLRWFYQNFRPHNPLSDNFLLMAWLQCSESTDPINPGVDPSLILKDLIDFIIQPIRNSTSQYIRRFERIVVTIDNTETLSTPQFHLMMEELANLSDLEIDRRFSIKFFLSDCHQPSLEQMYNVHNKIFYLPEWQAHELELILDVRLKVSQPGEFMIFPQLIHELCKNSIKPLPRDEPKKLLIREARSIYHHHTSAHSITYDAPVHLLKLTRGILAACAGSWEHLGLSVPFSLKEFQDVIDCYWHLPQEKE